MTARRLRLAFAFVLLPLAGVAAGQTLTVALGLDAGAGPPPRVRLAVHDLRIGDDAFEVGAGRLAGRFTAAAAWRRTLAAGPLGTLVLDGRVGWEAAGWGVGGSLRGTIGPVALRLDLDAGSRPAVAWAVLARAAAAAEVPAGDPARLTPGTAAWRADAVLGATWRIDRVWTLDATPRLHASPAGWAGGLAARVRRAGVAPDVDLAVRFDGAAGAAGGHAAVGLALHHVPRRSPESRIGAWWGGGPHGAGPGLEVAWAARAGDDLVALTLGLGPAWSDRPVAFAAAGWQRPWQGGSLALAGRAGPGDVSWALTWTRPLAN